MSVIPEQYYIDVTNADNDDGTFYGLEGKWTKEQALEFAKTKRLEDGERLVVRRVEQEPVEDYLYERWG